MFCKDTFIVNLPKLLIFKLIFRVYLRNGIKKITQRLIINIIFHVSLARHYSMGGRSYIQHDIT
jgi:hypothetical protein